ncbi:MAG: cytochrome c peroxidase [Saprospiraceae bacterium]|jgi:cytochrome c peroxidase
MNKITLIIGVVGILLVSSCQKEPENTINTELDTQLQTALEFASNGNGADYFLLPESNDFAAIPQDPLNPLTQEKVFLGQMLYHETGLALNPKHEFSEGTYSCASCHFASAGFQAGRVQGLSDGGIGFGINGEGRERGALYQADEMDAQPFKSPSTLNVAYQKNMLWNGQFGATGLNVGTEENWTVDTPKAVNLLGFEGVEVQAIAGLAVHRMKVDEQQEILLWYQTYFQDAFPEVPEEERYTREMAGLAIAAYERTLLPNKAPFQQWLKGGKSAMSDAEKRGAVVFFEKSNCTNCHTGPALNSMEFHAYGMEDLYACPEKVFSADADLNDYKGRGAFTGNVADNYKFKVPQLYNLEDSPFYGHGSSMRSIRQVLEYKNKARKENSLVPDSQLADDFVEQNLTDSELDDMEVFIKHALRDPDLMRYQPSTVVSGNCFPNNDPMSRSQLGCD